MLAKPCLLIALCLLNMNKAERDVRFGEDQIRLIPSNGAYECQSFAQNPVFVYINTTQIRMIF